MSQQEHSAESAPLAVVPTDVRSSRGRVLEFFLLKERVAAARRTRFEKTGPGFRDFELGALALKDARQLANSRAGRDTALLLYLSVIRLLARAVWRRRALGADDSTWEEVWARVVSVSEVASAVAAGKDPDHERVVEETITDELGEARLAELSPADRDRALATMMRVADALASPLEAEATLVQRLLWARRLRLSSLTLVVVGAFAWLVGTATARPNLALHQAVVVSDRDPRFGVDPAQLVDGDQSNLGFHTSERANTTVTIDLGSVRSVTRIKIFNRTDCCQERAVPLTLQVSADGREYKPVARRTHTFDHWTASLPAGTQARFIRLVHEKRDFFHLAEIEVY